MLMIIVLMQFFGAIRDLLQIMARAETALWALQQAMELHVIYNATCAAATTVVPHRSAGWAGLRC